MCVCEVTWQTLNVLTVLLVARTDKFTYLNDVWAIDVDTTTWHQLRCSGTGPAPRYGHTITVIDYKVYVIGGKGEAGALFNDVWCLDVEVRDLQPPANRPSVASL